MTSEMWVTLAILFAAIGLFISEKLRVDVVALGVVVALMLTNILTPFEALAGFSSTAVLTIASLFIVGGAVLQTGLAGIISNRMLRVATGETRLMIVIMLVVAAMSGFMSDTGVVAVMLPAIISLAATAKISPSRLLMPLAFGSLLGGAATLIGTPPNIIVKETLDNAIAAGMYSASTTTPFSFFSFTPMGILLIGAGVIFMMLIGRRLLPDHKPRQDIQKVETPKELMELYRLPDDLYRLRVRSQSPLIGKTLGESRLRQDYDINVLEISRPAQPRRVVRLGKQDIMLQASEPLLLRAEQDTVLQRDDILIARGEGNDIGRAAAYWNLAIQPAVPEDHDTLITHEVGIAEIVLPPRSSLIGKTLIDLQFGTHYRLTVLDIRRPGSNDKLDLKTTTLQFGDTLLVQGEWKNIFELKHRRRDFVVMGETETITGLQNQRKAPIATVILIGMIIFMVLGESSVVTASMLGGLAMVLFGCLTMDDAYDAIDWKSIVLIAGMLPMSTALVNVGLVDVIAAGFTDTLGELGPHVILGGLFLLTSVFTQVLSNTATAVLLAPIALATAHNLGVQPHAFLMAVAVAASMALSSPVASPVNTLVMGAGSYNFSDYAKIGIPMIIIMLLVTMIALPILWPF